MTQNGCVVLVGREYVETCMRLIEQANESIDFLFYYWSLHPHRPKDVISRIVTALADAEKRGVSVRVLTPSIAVQSLLQRMGISARVLHTEKVMHVKLAIFDGRYALIGSHNMTGKAMQSNWELSVGVHFDHKENRCTELFNNLYGV